jgi:hypothetical protein
VLYHGSVRAGPEGSALPDENDVWDSEDDDVPGLSSRAQAALMLAERARLDDCELTAGGHSSSSAGEGQGEGWHCAALGALFRCAAASEEERAGLPGEWRPCTAPHCRASCRVHVIRQGLTPLTWPVCLRGCVYGVGSAHSASTCVTQLHQLGKLVQEVLGLPLERAPWLMDAPTKALLLQLRAAASEPPHERFVVQRERAFLDAVPSLCPYAGQWGGVSLRPYFVPTLRLEHHLHLLTVAHASVH